MDEKLKNIYLNIYLGNIEAEQMNELKDELNLIKKGDYWGTTETIKSRRGEILREIKSINNSKTYKERTQ